jgi:hypothetical protein
MAARRLVAGALGLATGVSKEKREMERKQLKEAKGLLNTLIMYLNIHLTLNMKLETNFSKMKTYFDFYLIYT